MAETQTPAQDDFEEAREGVATGETYTPSAEEQKARDKRNLAVAFGIVAFVVLVFLTTVLRLTENMGAGG